MYSDKMIALREAQLLTSPAMRSLFPTGVPVYRVADSAGLTAQCMAAMDEHGTLTRRLTEEEQTFIAATRLRVVFDYPYFAERFCNTEEAPIWMADMTMRPIADVAVGDLVVGWDRLGGAALSRNANRHDRKGAHRLRDTLTQSQVLAKAERRTQVVRVVLESGRELRCTPDHLWRRGYGNRGGSWTKKGGARKQYFYPWTQAKVGRQLCHVISPRLFASLTSEEDLRLGGWLGGIFDGEGSHLKIGQSRTANPEICDQIARALKHFDIPFTQDDDGFYLVGGREGYARFQAVARPTKISLLPYIFSAAFGTPDRVVAVLPAGEATVVSLQTTTGNYVAWGYASKNCWIDQEGHGLRPLYPLWESQTLTLNVLGDLEWRRHTTGDPDGLLLNILKARQLGISTLAESLVAHRIVSRPHVRALSGADVEDQAGYLFRMVTRIYDQLPWFLKPGKLYFNKNRELSLANASYLKVAWGKSTRGALQSVTGMEGSKGAIGRGQTYSVLHISELATWDNPEQLDTALFPAVPISVQTLAILESTAEHAGDWWHTQWLTAAEGDGRFVNVFIPWYAEPAKYSLPAPVDWTPATTTTQHAQKAEHDSSKWRGRTIPLTRDQLYWYERTRAYYTKKGELHKFLKEYPADDQECFQYAGRAIFTFEQLDAIDRAGSRRPLLDVWAVEPAREIAELRRLPPEASERDAPLALPAPRRPEPPLSPRLISVAAQTAHETYPVPPGYGFRRLTQATLSELPSLRHSVLAIWEYPRVRGSFRYVMAVDVGDGLGQDYSIVDLIRLPTIDEPAEQVAQYVSNRIDTQALAFVCDAVGRFYDDGDLVEALAAIETNSHGLATQDTLQLHLGYSHFYVWEYADSASPDRRYSTKIGWVTTPRTRPLLISSFHAAITTFDPVTGLPDFVLNSPITRGELRHFVTEGTIGEAEAARGQHDDGVMAGAIGYYVAWRLAGGEAEPIAERRRRRAAQQAIAEHAGAPKGDWRNRAVTSAEADHQMEEDDEFADDLASGGAGGLHFEDRNRI
jgi:hypothetical protein